MTYRVLEMAEALMSASHGGETGGGLKRQDPGHRPRSSRLLITRLLFFQLAELFGFEAVFAIGASPDLAPPRALVTFTHEKPPGE